MHLTRRSTLFPIRIQISLQENSVPQVIIIFVLIVANRDTSSHNLLTVTINFLQISSSINSLILQHISWSGLYFGRSTMFAKPMAFFNMTCHASTSQTSRRSLKRVEARRRVCQKKQCWAWPGNFCCWFYGENRSLSGELGSLFTVIYPIILLAVGLKSLVRSNRLPDSFASPEMPAVRPQSEMILDSVFDFIAVLDLRFLFLSTTKPRC